MSVQILLDAPQASDVWNSDKIWQRLRVNGRLAALQEPECPEVWWWEIARLYPFEAPTSPLGLLLLLEDPQRWKDFVEFHCATWINMWIDNLEFRVRQDFMTDLLDAFLVLYNMPNVLLHAGEPTRVDFDNIRTIRRKRWKHPSRWEYISRVYVMEKNRNELWRLFLSDPPHFNNAYPGVLARQMTLCGLVDDHITKEKEIRLDVWNRLTALLTQTGKIKDEPTRI
jgi:hypothetical protein